MEGVAGAPGSAATARGVVVEQGAELGVEAALDHVMAKIADGAVFGALTPAQQAHAADKLVVLRQRAAEYIAKQAEEKRANGQAHFVMTVPDVHLMVQQLMQRP
jgi:hypothetical protein